MQRVESMGAGVGGGGGGGGGGERPVRRADSLTTFMCRLFGSLGASVS
jgi:hypothetical protein